ncbi:preprotein translocase subunit YajC [Engelhardtia mirabilis]|uniref:Sec translocon accessory complex subunit YajC n=1 Tax=Engelhardtia mirabilis TaxID=2528011 RepID=A0A518BJL9_9BACT|nr:preprotein translocase subunit YajC [Planctomycetes bacterium Pla133]QDV01489.1 preprotein translocase subunit YajC [Planctomycetes bacterium Pla86]
MTLLIQAQTQLAILIAPLFQEGVGGVGEGAAEGTGAATPTPGGGLMGFLPFLAIGMIFWFLLLGPERKRQKQRTAMLAQLKKGDRVLTTSGMFASVAQIHEHVVTLQLADGVRVKAARWAVQQVVENEDQAAGEVTEPRR